METKQVIVRYSDRKEVLKITPNSGLSDVEFLTRCSERSFPLKKIWTLLLHFSDTTKSGVKW